MRESKIEEVEDNSKALDDGPVQMKEEEEVRKSSRQSVQPDRPTYSSLGNPLLRILF